jgi:phospholipid/cholesterol/gamma-HCH transport system substrate-binding protein
MTSSKAELTVGIFALAVLAVLSFMTFRVGEFVFLEKEGYSVYADFLNTAGLDEKTKVKIAGVDTGTVEKIELVGGEARVTIRMEPGITLYSDAAARIKSTGLLGDKYLELQTGSVEPALRDGDEIKDVADIADIDDLVRNLTSISVKLVDFMEDINQKDLLDSLKKTLLNLQDITGDLKSVVSENRESFTQVLDSLSSITARVDGFLDEYGAPLSNSITNVEAFSAHLKDQGPELLENLNEASKKIRAVMEETGPEFTSVARKASTTMDTIAGISNRIESGEGTLGKLVKDEELYESLKRAAKGLDKTLGAAERFKTYVTFRNDFLTRVDENKGAFFLKLQPREDKYYIVGAVKDPVGTVRTKETITNGSTTREETVFEDKIELTAHFAKRYRDTSLRIGVTESTFGVGADQFFLDDKLMLSLDAWDFNEDEQFADKIHLRFGVDYFLFKNLFVSGGFDNFLDSDRGGVFLGGGLMFEDEDLKYLLGPASNLAGR